MTTSDQIHVLPLVDRPLLVVVDRTGPCLPRTAQRQRYQLDATHLRVLVDRAGGVAAEPDDVRAVADDLGSELAARGLRTGDERVGGDATDDLYHADHHSLLGAEAATAAPPPVAADDGDVLILVSPDVWLLTARGLGKRDHHGGRRIWLSPAQFVAATCFVEPCRLDEALQRQRVRLGPAALSEPDLAALVAELRSVGLLTVARPDGGATDGREMASLRKALAQNAALIASTDAWLERHDREEAERTERTHVARTRVVPVDLQHIPQLSLGLVLASARVWEDGRLEDRFDFLPDWTNRSATRFAPGDPPAVFLFSNYLWTHPANLGESKRLKQLSPGSLTIHGGPDTPKYREDVERYLRVNDHVDLMVRGEGEATVPELLDALESWQRTGELDTDRLRQVAGISFRDGDEIVMTDDRERIVDIDALPSPFLTGLFDTIGDQGLSLAVIETNRGCPYGCTFCDWGSATASRIRKFSLERVFAELEWCATHRVHGIYLADANFGIFPRDVEIAQKVADLRRTVGYPKVFETNYAKNTVKHLRECVEILAEGGIITEGILSLQSMDEETLSAIRRSNIKLEKYEALATEFRRAGLPLVVDIMMGLPGSTVESFANDLQECIDREVRARVFPAQLLVNSPMNEPAYREEHQIVTRASIADTWTETDPRRKKIPIVVSSASFTAADYEKMKQARQLFRLCENFGVLRQVGRYVRQELGLREVDFYTGLAASARVEPRLAVTDFVVQAVPYYMVPPVSWQLFVDELRWYLVDVLGVRDDAALTTVLRVQHALLPDRGRQFPLVLDLAHDYAGWYADMLTTKEAGGYATWTGAVTPLRERPPASFEVTDPAGICELSIGFRLDFDSESDWELGSPVARAMSRRHLHL